MVKAFIDARYRTKPETESTAIGGAGQSALGAIAVVQEKPEAFGKLVLLSPQLHVGEKTVAAVIGDGAVFKGKKVWLDASPDAAGSGAARMAARARSALRHR